MVNNNKPAIRFKGFTDAWEQRELGELLTVHSFKPYLAEPQIDGNYEVIQQGDNPIAGYANGKPFQSYKDVTLFGDHTLSLYKVKCPFFVASDGLKILSSQELDGRFLFSLLERCKPVSEGYKRHYSILKEVEAFYPKSTDEQVQIGSYFEFLDNLITLHQRKYDKLQNVKKSMLEKMFPKNGSNVPEIRFKGFTDAWEQREFETVVNVCSGRDYKHLSNGDIPVYGTGGYMLSVNEALSYDKDAVGIGRKGTIDKPYLLKAPFWTVDTLFFCIPKQQYDLDFVYSVFQKINWKQKDESTGVPSLSKIAINSIDIFAPDCPEQSQIGKFFTHLDNLITLHQRELTKLKNIKKSCLEKMFV